ncbi:hypothetical protein K2Z84_20165 [Candidatus Binatia bacterium]|nr:hypothetical protein [Candidatus Binatia bacterium]
MSIKQGCLVLAAFLALLHFSRFDVRQAPIVTDVRYYVHFAPRVADGAVPHRDFFDNKTQLATFAGAAFVRAGRALGIDPLLAMRTGFLALSWLAAMLLFAILRRLYGGSCVIGLLGMLCYLGFSLLGFLPALGPLPKLLMGISASLAALLAAAGWWTTAGAFGAVAFLDWQIGVLAGLGVFAAALCERDARLATAVRTACGGIAVLFAGCAWFAWHGALGVTWRQVVLTSLARGETALAHKTFSGRVLQILDTIHVACPGHRWLVALGVVGMALFPLLAWRLRGSREQRLVIVLAVFHYGIVAFSLTDYQAYGDLFALLASLAVFAAVALGEAYRVLAMVVARSSDDPAVGARRARVLAIATVLLAALVLRAGRPRLDIVLPDKIAKGAASLADQESVTRQIRALTSGRGSVVFVNCPEQLYLTHHVNPLPFGFWNRATYAYFRDPADPQVDPLARMVDELHPDAVLCPTRRLDYDLTRSGAFERVVLHADTGQYRVIALVRRATPLAPSTMPPPPEPPSSSDDE